MPPPPLPHPHPRPPALFRTLGSTATPIVLSSPDSSDDDDDASTATSTPHARVRVGDATMQDEMLDDLRPVFQGGHGGNWCVGGSIAVEGGGDFPSSSVRVPPIIIRFDKPDGSTSKVQFPLVEKRSGSGFQELLRACTPSALGRSEGSERVGELDVQNFSTDFHPHDCGIIDTIAQTLIPGIERSRLEKGKEWVERRDELSEVKAELLRLNVSLTPWKMKTLANVGRYIPHRTLQPKFRY
jgi:hypothetical protein